MKVEADEKYICMADDNLFCRLRVKCVHHYLYICYSFQEDYYDTGCDLLPIRWMAPESLELKQGVWQSTQFTCQSNVWYVYSDSFSLTLCSHVIFLITQL